MEGKFCSRYNPTQDYKRRLMSVEVWPISHPFLVLQLLPQPNSSIEVMDPALQQLTAGSVVLDNVDNTVSHKGMSCMQLEI
jgi:hypothetical protein